MNEQERYMAEDEYYPEEVLIEKMQSGEFTWVDYVKHFSKEWREEYNAYCLANKLCISEETAREFVKYKDEQLEAEMRENQL